MSNTLEEKTKPYSKAIVKLLKGVVNKNSSNDLWETILNYQFDIQEYIAQIGLELIIKKEEGFAFVKQIKDEEGNTLGLVSRRQIGFESSVVLIVLRQSLEEFDSNPTQLVAEKIISNQEIKEELELFLPEGYNRVKFYKDLEKHIQKAVELGYLKEVSRTLDEVKYQIHRIIKEKITLDILQDFKVKLQSYVEPV